MLCQQAREHLSAYLDRELSADLSAAVRAHLDACADCRHLLADLRATAGLLGRLPVHAAPQHLAQDVQRELERRSILERAPHLESPPHERTLPLRRARLWPRALAVAATLVLAAGIGLFAWLGRQPGEMPSATHLAAGREGVLTEELAMKDGRSTDRALPPVALERFAGEVGFTEGRAGDNYAGADTETAPAEEVADSNSLAMTGAVEAEGHRKAGGGSAWDFADGAVGSAEPETMKRAYAERKAREFDENANALVLGDGSNLTADPGLEAGVEYGVNTMPAGGLARVAPDVEASLDTGTALAAVTESGADLHFKADGLERGPGAVQAVMNYVAVGQAPVADLAAVATGENLSQADNQIVLCTTARAEANRELTRLFAANRWRPVAPAAPARRMSEKTAPSDDAAARYDMDKDTRAGALAAGTYGKAGPSAGAAGASGTSGVYYLARQNGEDTWVILTDRDHLSRFGSQLAQADAVTVSMDSSAPFQGLNRLQAVYRRNRGVQTSGYGYQIAGADRMAKGVAGKAFEPKGGADAGALKAPAEETQQQWFDPGDALAEKPGLEKADAEKTARDLARPSEVAGKFGAKAKAGAETGEALGTPAGEHGGESVQSGVQSIVEGPETHEAQAAPAAVAKAPSAKTAPAEPAPRTDAPAQPAPAEAPAVTTPGAIAMGQQGQRPEERNLQEDTRQGQPLDETKAGRGRGPTAGSGLGQAPAVAQQTMRPEARPADDAPADLPAVRPATAPAAPPSPRKPRGEELSPDNALAQVRTNLDRAKKEQRPAEDRKQAGAARQAAPMLRNLWGSTIDFTDYGRLVLPPNQVLVVVRVRPVETAAEAAIQVETVPPDATQRRAVEQAAPAKE